MWPSSAARLRSTWPPRVRPSRRPPRCSAIRKPIRTAWLGHQPVGGSGSSGHQELDRGGRCRFGFVRDVGLRRPHYRFLRFHRGRRAARFRRRTPTATARTSPASSAAGSSASPRTFASSASRCSTPRAQGRTSDVLRAIQFAIDNKDALGIRVVNLSLGHPVYEPAASDPLVQAVESAVRAGLVVVDVGRELRREPGHAPAGLRGADLARQRPVRADGRCGSDVRHAVARRRSHRALQLARALVVRRVREARRRGARTRAALDRRSGQRCCASRTKRAADRDSTCALSGTSMAAGVASGLVALVLQVNPGLTPNARQGRPRVHVDPRLRRRRLVRPARAGRRRAQRRGRHRAREGHRPVEASRRQVAAQREFPTAA